jgi:hypothetical protein
LGIELWLEKTLRLFWRYIVGCTCIRLLSDISYIFKMVDTSFTITRGGYRPILRSFGAVRLSAAKRGRPSPRQQTPLPPFYQGAPPLAAQSFEAAEVPPFLLPRPSSHESLEADAAWVAETIRMWLDEEWTPLDVHRDLGLAAGRSYLALRREGIDDASDLLLGLCAGELMQCDYKEAFVNAFEVANKVAEFLMLREGCDVCCTTAADREAAARFLATHREAVKQEQESRCESGK